MRGRRCCRSERTARWLIAMETRVQRPVSVITEHPYGTLRDRHVVLDALRRRLTRREVDIGTFVNRNAVYLGLPHDVAADDGVAGKADDPLDEVVFTVGG